jgi:hypothetical protein
MAGPQVLPGYDLRPATAGGAGSNEFARGCASTGGCSGDSADPDRVAAA